MNHEQGDNTKFSTGKIANLTAEGQKNKSNGVIAYLLLGMVFLLGFYIVIVALLATSWVQLNALTEREEEEGYARLTSVIEPPRLTEIETLISKAASDPVLREAKAAVEFLTIDQDDKDRLSATIEVEQDQYSRFIKALEDIRTNDSVLRKEISDYIMNEAAPAILNSAYSRLDRRLYELALTEKLTSVVSASQRKIDNLTSSAREIDREWRNAVKDWQPQFVNLANSASDAADVRVSTASVNLSTRTYYQSSAVNQAKVDDFIGRAGSTAAKYEDESKPNEPTSSEAWGPIGATASWLIGPASIELVYIIGMIGFGILGSSLTTFVGFQIKEETENIDNPNLLEVIGVVVKGVTAAIVVFLFIFGGFEVFSNENTQTVTPNAYMLFLTCFLGAVFSDRIWTYARERLTERLKSSQTHSSDSATTKL